MSALVVRIPTPAPRSREPAGTTPSGSDDFDQVLRETSEDAQTQRFSRAGLVATTSNNELPDAAAPAVTPLGPPAPGAPDPMLALAAASSSAALTPLEQAVAELVGDAVVVEEDEPEEVAIPWDGPSPLAEPAVPDPGTLEPSTLDPSSLVGTGDVLDAGPIGRPAATGPLERASPVLVERPPELASHVHLVLDDGTDRVVMTVAVRGADVHVAMRASDDATATELVRHAASLDHALRARGLDLAGFTAEHEREREAPADREPPPRRSPPRQPPREEEPA